MANDDDKATPLIIAARYGHFEVCQFLVSNGADVTVESKFGTAMELTKKEGYDRIADFLRSVM